MELFDRTCVKPALSRNNQVIINTREKIYEHKFVNIKFSSLFYAIF